MTNFPEQQFESLCNLLRELAGEQSGRHYEEINSFRATGSSTGSILRSDYRCLYFRNQGKKYNIMRICHWLSGLFAFSSHRHPASGRFYNIPARSFAALTHRLVRFQLTSPLAYIFAQLFEPRLFSTTSTTTFLRN